MDIIKPLNVTQLKEKIEKKQHFFLVDVREKWEFENSAIPFAENIPLSTFCVEDFMDRCTRKLGEIRDSASIVMQCRSGKRSLQAASQVLAQYPELNIYNLEGGILAWEKEN